MRFSTFEKQYQEKDVVIFIKKKIEFKHTNEFIYTLFRFETQKDLYVSASSKL